MEDLNLTPIQLRVLVALAAGKSNIEAAAEAGISVSTLEKWKRNPAFKKKLFESSAKLFDVTLAQLSLASSDAVKILVGIIEDDETPAKIKVSAISVVLSFSKYAREFLLESRIAALEEFLEK